MPCKGIAGNGFGKSVYPYAAMRRIFASPLRALHVRIVDVGDDVGSLPEFYFFQFPWPRISVVHSAWAEGISEKMMPLEPEEAVYLIILVLPWPPPGFLGPLI